MVAEGTCEVGASNGDWKAVAFLYVQETCIDLLGH